MAPNCFWTRRACSRYAALALPLPSGSSLAAHVERCSDCRGYWAGLSVLTSDLDRLISVPHPSISLTSRVWERPPRNAAAFRRGRASLVAAAVSGLACGWGAWRLSSQLSPLRPPRAVVNATTKMPDEAPAAVARDHSRPIRLPSTWNPDSRLANINAPQPSGLAWIPVRHERRPGRPLERGRQPRRSPRPEMYGTVAPEDWRASGLVFEAQGDPGLANVAYQAAYQQQPSEEIAFDMGRTAEESGDMEQALDVYAGLLESAAVKTRDEKGWKP